MTERVTAQTDLIVGVGSGVLQDLCKYVSFRHKLPYHIVATAPSFGTTVTAGGFLCTRKCRDLRLNHGILHPGEDFNLRPIA